MAATHHYALSLKWMGNTGRGTTSYEAYERNYKVWAEGKPEIHASSDPHFRGNAALYNPEELFLSAIAGCHMLWYLHLCAIHGVVLHDYEDAPCGQMDVEATGGGRFTEIILRPRAIIKDYSMNELARTLHHKAHELCFLAASVNFPIYIQPKIFMLS